METALRSSRALVAAAQAIEGSAFQREEGANILKASTIAASETLPDWSDEATINAVAGQNPRTAMIDDESWAIANHLVGRAGQRTAFMSIQAAQGVAGSPDVDTETAAKNAAHVAIELIRSRGE